VYKRNASQNIAVSPIVKQDSQPFSNSSSSGLNFKGATVTITNGRIAEIVEKKSDEELPNKMGDSCPAEGDMSTKGKKGKYKGGRKGKLTAPLERNYCQLSKGGPIRRWASQIR